MKDFITTGIVNLFENKHIYLRSNLKLGDVSKELGIKKSDLKKFYKSEVDYTFKEMLNIYRLAQAKRLLKETNTPYKSLWNKSGFKSLKEFNKAISKLGF